MVDNNHFDAVIEVSFKGMDHLVTMRTVVGDTAKIDDAIILSLMDVTCGVAAGTFAKNSKDRGGGGMSVRMNPSAILVIQNGSARLVNIKNQNTVSKMPDMMPGVVSKLTNGKAIVEEEFSADVVKAAEEMTSAEAEKTE